IGIAAPSVAPQILPLLLLRGVDVLCGMNGIQVQVTGDFQKIAVCIYQKGLVSPLVEMTGSPVSHIEVGRVGDIEMAHQFLEVCMRRFHDEMKMVGHEDEGDQTNLVDLN